MAHLTMSTPMAPEPALCKKPAPMFGGLASNASGRAGGAISALRPCETRCMQCSLTLARVEDTDHP